jgi:hypothetical protein
MVDPILNARLDVLEQELNLTNNPGSWFQKLCLNRLESEDLTKEWYKFANLLGDYLQGQKRILDDIRRKLKEIEQQDDQAAREVMSQAWADYTRALDRSQVLFREFLEYIGGLIFRDKEFDAQICELADELIRFCSGLVFTGSSMSVPAARDSLAKSVGWMVRVRFPEWTIWTLPFAAYEYGHVVLNEFNRLKGLINEEVHNWLSTDPEFQNLPAEKQEIEKREGPLKERAESYVKEFLADAFATYLMGPAYAFPAILLRFDPSSPLSHHRPPDSHRAYVVLEILESMNKGHLKPYDWVISYLTEKWAETRERVNAAEITNAEKAQLDALVTGWSNFPPMFMPTAKYPDSGPDGWLIAAGWAQEWSNQLNAPGGQLEPLDGIDHSSRLRDVLNAAWICRVRGNGDNTPVDMAKISQIATAAKNLMEEIRYKVVQQKRDHQSKAFKKMPKPRQK